MDTDKMLKIVKKHLLQEHLHLPVPLDSERVLEMINVSLDNAKKEIDYELSKKDNK